MTSSGCLKSDVITRIDMQRKMVNFVLLGVFSKIKKRVSEESTDEEYKFLL